jgi:hypothetical protein
LHASDRVGDEVGMVHQKNSATQAIFEDARGQSHRLWPESVP